MNWYKLSETKYFYHGTFDDKIFSIWKEGLKPSEETHWGGDLGVDSMGKVFFCIDPKNSEFYTRIVTMANYDASDMPEVFLLRVPSNYLKDIKQTGRTGIEDEYYVERIVPPDQIDILWGEHGWKPLKSLDAKTVEGVSMGEWRENSIVFDEDISETQKGLNQQAMEDINMNKIIKTARKPIPSANELAAYVEALKVHRNRNKIKDEESLQVINNLPPPSQVRDKFSEEECRLLFDSIVFAWKKVTGQDLIEESKVMNFQDSLEGNYWMIMNGILMGGPNHFTIVKKNMELFRTLLNIHAFVLHEKLSSPPNELIKTVLDHGGMRVFINRTKNGFFQLTDKTYSKWGRAKIKKLDLKKKIVKVIDSSTPYKGWDSGIIITL